MHSPLDVRHSIHSLRHQPGGPRNRRRCRCRRHRRQRPSRPAPARRLHPAAALPLARRKLVPATPPPPVGCPPLEPDQLHAQGPRCCSCRSSCRCHRRCPRAQATLVDAAAARRAPVASRPRRLGRRPRWRRRRRLPPAQPPRAAPDPPLHFHSRQSPGRPSRQRQSRQPPAVRPPLVRREARDPHRPLRPSPSSSPSSTTPKLARRCPNPSR